MKRRAGLNPPVAFEFSGERRRSGVAERKAELDKLNITDEGKRRVRFHQWLTDDGRTILTREIGKVEGIMEMCNDIDHFKAGCATSESNHSRVLPVQRAEPGY